MKGELPKAEGVPLHIGQPVRPTFAVSGPHVDTL